jgi:hypothetical protein
MAEYLYYLARDAYGKPLELFRGPVVDPIEFCANPELWRAKRDGTWSDAWSEIKWVIERMNQGDFDPENNLISEPEAVRYLSEWRARSWPGRA